jgi:hypothetical protein
MTFSWTESFQGILFSGNEIVAPHEERAWERGWGGLGLPLLFSWGGYSAPPPLSPKLCWRLMNYDYLNYYYDYWRLMNCDYLDYPRADGAKRRARELIPPGYLHPGKRKH